MHSVLEEKEPQRVLEAEAPRAPLPELAPALRPCPLSRVLTVLTAVSPQDASREKTSPKEPASVAPVHTRWPWSWVTGALLAFSFRERAPVISATSPKLLRLRDPAAGGEWASAGELRSPLG